MSELSPPALPDEKLNARHELEGVVLIGFMGCGKSSIANILSRRLGWPAYDLDHIIEKNLGRSVAQFFASHGEAAFRALETQELRENLSRRGILATGGGVVTRAENRELLQRARQRGHSCVIYLRARAETLALRIRRQPGVRPLIDGDRVLNLQETRERVQFLLQQRAAWYEECADFAVDGDGLSARQVAEIITAYVAPDSVFLREDFHLDNAECATECAHEESFRNAES